MYAETPLSDNPVPSVQAILLCEKIIEEAVTGKKSLVNIFTGINSLGLPVIMSMGLYARMIDGEGNYEFKIDLVHLPTDRKIGTIVMPSIHATDRLRAMEVVIHIPRIEFPEFGKYEFQLFGDNVFLGHVSIDVVDMQQGGKS